jgi:hypothetical protein
LRREQNREVGNTEEHFGHSVGFRRREMEHHKMFPFSYFLAGRIQE